MNLTTKKAETIEDAALRAADAIHHELIELYDRFYLESPKNHTLKNDLRRLFLKLTKEHVYEECDETTELELYDLAAKLRSSWWTISSKD